jgi:hypothetical protein
MCLSQGATASANVRETRAPVTRTPGTPDTAAASMPSPKTLSGSSSKPAPAPQQRVALPPAPSPAKKQPAVSLSTPITSDTAICSPSDANLIDSNRLAETLPMFLKDWASKVNPFAGSHYKEQRRPADNMNLVTLQKALGISGSLAFNLSDLADGAKKNQCIMRCAQELKKQLPP